MHILRDQQDKAARHREHAAAGTARFQLAVHRTLIIELDEILGLADRINVLNNSLEDANRTLEGKVRERTEELAKINWDLAQKNEIMEIELVIASEIQKSIFPNLSWRKNGLALAGHYRPLQKVGGDYYDFIEVTRGSEEETIIAVGDVMGHGVAAALLMASARAALRAHAFDTGQLADLLSKVNRVLATDRNFRFMTLALAAINTRSGVMRWASAGHYPPIVYHASQDSFAEHDGGGVPLGIEQGVAYEEYEFRGITNGDIIVLGSDGIWETQNSAGVQFGMPRLHEVIRLNRKQPASSVAKAIENALSSFRGAVAAEDDVTYVVIKVRGQLNESIQQSVTASANRAPTTSATAP